MITYPSNEFNLFFHIWFQTELPQQIVIAFLTHVPMMNLTILFRKKIPRMINRYRAFPQNSVLYHHLFAAAIADYALQLTITFVLLHLILALPSCFQTGGALFFFSCNKNKKRGIPSTGYPYIIRQNDSFFKWKMLYMGSRQPSSPHDNSIFRGIPVIALSHRFLGETKGFIEPAGAAIAFANLQTDGTGLL